MDISRHYSESLRDQTEFTITGHILEGGPRGFLILVPCWCVHDSPESPCKCPDLFKLIIPEDLVLRNEEHKGRRSSAGENMSKVSVSMRADILLEAAVSFNVAEVAGKLAKLRLPGSAGFPCGGSTGPTFPVPEGGEPVVYMIGGLLGGLLKKYGPGVLAAIGGAVLGEIFDGSDCTTTTTTESYVNAEGKTVTKTVQVEVCN